MKKGEISSGQLDNHTIPQVIHVIWAGGNFRLPDKNMCALLQWGIANPDWQLYIWVDQI